MKKITTGLVLCAALAFSPQLANAANQPRGHIKNIDGKSCTFRQSTVPESYLHSLKASTGNLVFDDPECMSAEGLANGVNQMMIANFIAKPYAQPDAAFATRPGQFRSGSALQVRGVCIQSSTYSTIGVVAEFQSSGDHIIGVKHAIALQGCSK